MEEKIIKNIYNIIDQLLYGTVSGYQPSKDDIIRLLNDILTYWDINDISSDAEDYKESMRRIEDRTDDIDFAISDINEIISEAKEKIKNKDSDVDILYYFNQIKDSVSDIEYYNNDIYSYCD